MEWSGVDDRAKWCTTAPRELLDCNSSDFYFIYFCCCCCCCAIVVRNINGTHVEPTKRRPGRTVDDGRLKLDLLLQDMAKCTLTLKTNCRASGISVDLLILIVTWDVLLMQPTHTHTQDCADSGRGRAHQNWAQLLPLPPHHSLSICPSVCWAFGRSIVYSFLYLRASCLAHSVTPMGGISWHFIVMSVWEVLIKNARPNCNSHVAAAVIVAIFCCRLRFLSCGRRIGCTCC